MKLSAPLHVHWELTNACNLKCLHCYQQNDSKRSGGLSEENILGIAKKLVKGGVFQITLTGGEPFLLGYLEQLIGFFNFNGIVPQVSSNGTLVNNSIAKWLSKYEVKIQISLDSHKPETHNYIRQSKDSFERVLSAIDSLQEYDIPLSLAFCANSQNYLEIENLILLAISLKIKKLSVGEIMPLYGYRSNTLAFSQDEYLEFIGAMKTLKNRYSSVIDIEFISEWGFLYSTDIEHHPCTAMDRDMAILYDGSVVPCPFIRHPLYSMGNLVYQDIQDIWHGNPAEKWRNDKHGGCSSDCTFYKNCMSGCKAFLANAGLPVSSVNSYCAIQNTIPLVTFST